jgi:hypothetical protein
LIKKLSIITLSLLLSSAFANNYVVLIDEKTNSYEVGGFTDNVETSEWGLKETNCSVDKTESEVYYGSTYLQTETCIEEYERTVTTTRTYTNGSSEIISVGQEISQNTLPLTTKNITGTHLESSCKGILDNNYSVGDGVYSINNSKLFSVYCDMTTNGGGWTMVTAQFEQDPVINWNEGIQSDYDPTLSTKKGFALNTSEIPPHSQISMSQTNYDGMNTSNKYFNYVYTTGNIPVTHITELSSNSLYAIHRNTSEFFGRHDPEAEKGTLNEWYDTLTIDLVDELVYGQYSFAFSPENTAGREHYRGYSYNGESLVLSSESGAWVVWVR